MNTIQTAKQQAGRISKLPRHSNQLNPLVLTLAAVLAGTTVQAFVFSTGSFTTAATAGLTDPVPYVKAVHEGTGSFVAGNATFTASTSEPGGALGSDGFGTWNGSPSQAIPTFSDTSLNPIMANFAVLNFGGTAVRSLSGLSVGQEYELRLMWYDGDTSLTSTNYRGNYTVAIGADSVTFNTWNLLGLPANTFSSSRGSEVSYTFFANAPSLNVSLTAEAGKALIFTAYSLEQVPEPSTILLLGLGGLVVLARRSQSFGEAGWRKLRGVRQA